MSARPVSGGACYAEPRTSLFRLGGFCVGFRTLSGRSRILEYTDRYDRGSRQCRQRCRVAARFCARSPSFDSPQWSCPGCCLALRVPAHGRDLLGLIPLARLNRYPGHKCLVHSHCQQHVQHHVINNRSLLCNMLTGLLICLAQAENTYTDNTTGANK